MAGLKTFDETTFDLVGAVILLDVDGTLTPDRELNFGDKTLNKIQALSAANRVYICTNTRDAQRRETLIKMLGLPVTDSRYKKPSSKVLTGIDRDGCDLIVIGDKFITDYLLTRNIGARFIKVRRKESGQERFTIKLLNWVDDCLSALFL